MLLLLLSSTRTLAAPCLDLFGRHLQQSGIERVLLRSFKDRQHIETIDLIPFQLQIFLKLNFEIFFVFSSNSGCVFFVVFLNFFLT